MASHLYAPFNNFLTSGLRATEPETLRRIRVLNLFSLVFVILSPLLGLFYFYLGALTLCYALVAAGLLAIGLILFLRITKNPAAGGNAAVFILWAVLAIIRWNTGGMSAGGLMLLSWVWDAAVILLAIFFAGYLWGALWTCVVFLESGVAVSLFRSGYAFPNLIPPETASVYSLGSYLLGLLTILLLAFLFEKDRNDAHMREREKLRMVGESRVFMENILDRVPVPTFVLDNHHRVVHWNRACQEITRVPSQDILGKKVWEGFSLGDDGSLADEILDNPSVLPEKCEESAISKTDSGSFIVETFLPKVKGGIRARIRSAPLLDQSSNIKGAVQFIQDIGKGNSQTSADGTNGPDYPVFKIDSRGKICGWNKACEERFGYSFAQMFGKSPLSLISKSDWNGFRNTVVEVFGGRSFDGREWKCYGAGGEAVHVLARAYPVFSLSGKVEECVVSNTDITRLKMRLIRLERHAAERKAFESLAARTTVKLKKISEEHDLLKRNISTIIRKKDESEIP
jgi:PAS domain S-box-containing protein